MRNNRINRGHVTAGHLLKSQMSHFDFLLKRRKKKCTHFTKEEEKYACVILMQNSQRLAFDGNLIIFFGS